MVAGKDLVDYVRTCINPKFPDLVTSDRIVEFLQTFEVERLATVLGLYTKEQVDLEIRETMELQGL